MLVTGREAWNTDSAVGKNTWAIIANFIKYILSNYHIPSTKYSVSGVDPLLVVENLYKL